MSHPLFEALCTAEASTTLDPSYWENRKKECDNYFISCMQSAYSHDNYGAVFYEAVVNRSSTPALVTRAEADALHAMFQTISQRWHAMRQIGRSRNAQNLFNTIWNT